MVLTFITHAKFFVNCGSFFEILYLNLLEFFIFINSVKSMQCQTQNFVIGFSEEKVAT